MAPSLNMKNLWAANHTVGCSSLATGALCQKSVYIELAKKFLWDFSIRYNEKNLNKLFGHANMLRKRKNINETCRLVCKSL